MLGLWFTGCDNEKNCPSQLHRRTSHFLQWTLILAEHFSYLHHCGNGNWTCEASGPSHRTSLHLLVLDKKFVCDVQAPQLSQHSAILSFLVRFCSLKLG